LLFYSISVNANSMVLIPFCELNVNYTTILAFPGIQWASFIIFNWWYAIVNPGHIRHDSWVKVSILRKETIKIQEMPYSEHSCI
jgi:hypothetical protein